MGAGAANRAGAPFSFEVGRWVPREMAGAAGRTIGAADMAKRWYSVSVLSNFEKKIAEQIRAKVAEKGLEDKLDEVLVPTEDVIEMRRGKKVQSERRFMPGYVLVHMELGDD